MANRMSCEKGSEHLADLLLAPESVAPVARAHVASCPACQQELADLRATMALMDEWAAPDPTPYFDTRLHARLRSEQAAPPAGLFERLRARILFGSNMHLRPIAAGALALMLLAGGGTFAGINMHHKVAATDSATVRDLQNLDRNAQVFQQLDALDGNDNDADDATSNL